MKSGKIALSYTLLISTLHDLGAAPLDEKQAGFAPEIVKKNPVDCSVRKKGEAQGPIGHKGRGPKDPPCANTQWRREP